MTNCPGKGHGHSHVTILGIYTPLNISGTAEARDVKFCVAVDYIEF